MGVDMNERRRIEERLRKKEQEIQTLEEQVKDARVYIQALQDVLKMLPKEPDGESSPESVLRPGSTVAQARKIIKTRGNPVHIDDILKMLGKDVTRENKAALSGSLAAYVRRGEIFTRPAPNTFGLVEMDKPPTLQAEPPPHFGEDSPSDNILK
jgi:hypothetical protein